MNRLIKKANVLIEALPYIRTFKGKYGTAYDALRGLTLEIKEACENKKLL